MKKISEDAVATNTTAGISSLSTSDPTNPPVIKKPKKLSVILKRKPV